LQTGHLIICSTGAAEGSSPWVAGLLNLFLVPDEKHISHKPDSRLSVLGLLHHRDYFKDCGTTSILGRFVCNGR